MYVDNEAVKEYGFNFLDKSDLEAAITFRASILVDASFVNAPEMRRCIARIHGPGVDVTMRYSSKHYSFL